MELWVTAGASRLKGTFAIWSENHLWPLVRATHTNTKLSICRVQWDVLGHTVGQWAGAQLGHLWHRTGPAALPAVGNSAAGGGTALHPRLWAPVPVLSLSGVHLAVGTVETRWSWCGQ